MRAITKAAAALTVVGAVLLSPLFTRLLATHDLVQEPILVKPQRRVELPPDWSVGVFQQLNGRRVPMEVTDLKGLIRVVETTAARFHLNPLVVLAVIHVESGFNPYAISPAGSVGLMQLQVGTAREVAARLGLSWGSDEDLLRPELNVLLGTYYLKQLLDRFGDLDLALAAFHAGPTRIQANNLRLGPASLAYADRVWSALLEFQSSSRA